MNIENSTITVQNSGSWKDYWVLQVWEEIDSGYAQRVYELQWKYNWIVLKTLREASHDDVFIENFRISNVKFYYTVLETLQKIWVILPPEWDVVNIWDENREEIAFLQSYIANINMRVWSFARLPSWLNTEPLVKVEFVKAFSLNEDGQEVFIDWDELIVWASKNIRKDIATDNDLERLRSYWDTYEWYMYK